MWSSPYQKNLFELPRDEYLWPVLGSDENVSAGEPAGKCTDIVYEYSDHKSDAVA